MQIIIFLASTANCKLAFPLPHAPSASSSAAESLKSKLINLHGRKERAWKNILHKIHARINFELHSIKTLNCANFMHDVSRMESEKKRRAPGLAPPPPQALPWHVEIALIKKFWKLCYPERNEVELPRKFCSPTTTTHCSSQQRRKLF